MCVCVFYEEMCVGFRLRFRALWIQLGFIPVLNILQDFYNRTYNYLIPFDAFYPLYIHLRQDEVCAL